MDQENTIQQTKTHVRNKLEGSGHDWWHPNTIEDFYQGNKVLLVKMGN